MMLLKKRDKLPAPTPDKRSFREFRGPEYSVSTVNPLETKPKTTEEPVHYDETIPLSGPGPKGEASEIRQTAEPTSRLPKETVVITTNHTVTITSAKTTIHRQGLGPSQPLPTSENSTSAFRAQKDADNEPPIIGITLGTVMGVIMVAYLYLRLFIPWAYRLKHKSSDGRPPTTLQELQNMEKEWSDHETTSTKGIGSDRGVGNSAVWPGCGQAMSGTAGRFCGG